MAYGPPLVAPPMSRKDFLLGKAEEGGGIWHACGDIYRDGLNYGVMKVKWKTYFIRVAMYILFLNKF
jgi:hypothetical protein